MAKTPEELLKPRYKLIADYPGCGYEVGTILEVAEDGELYSRIAGYQLSVVKIMESEVIKFSHLIHKLEWWEDREERELPKYIRIIKDVMPTNRKLDSFGETILAGTVILVKRWDVNVPYINSKEFVVACYTEPVTKDDYDHYLETLNK